MFKINLFLARLFCAVAGILLDLADALYKAGKFLYRPLPRSEAERILQQADPDRLAQAAQDHPQHLAGEYPGPALSLRKMQCR